MLLFVILLCLSHALTALAGNSTTTVMDLIFKGDSRALNQTADAAWKVLASTHITEAQNQILTYLGLNASLIHAEIEERQLNQSSFRSMLKSVGDVTVGVDSSICDALGSQISRTCKGTPWARIEARKISDDLERQVELCRSGVSAMSNYSTERALKACLASTTLSKSLCYVGAQQCLARTSSLTKRDKMTPQQRLLIEGSSEAGLGVLLFALMIPYGYTALPLLAAGGLEAVGIRDILQSLRMAIDAQKKETRVPTAPAINGLDF
jgi:hypothetical protein